MTSVPSAEEVRGVFARFRAIGLDTNFFEGGFSSAMLVQVLDGLRELGLTLTLVDLYRFPTVRALAAEAAMRADPDAGHAPRAPLPWARAEQAQ